ncbi:MAG: hypothetical protein J2P54_07680 [Bradyrhizobiaceae bacterium]|nr:hypothetical protein [Bradyrhizobiaceae bacterium]
MSQGNALYWLGLLVGHVWLILAALAIALVCFSAWVYLARNRTAAMKVFGIVVSVVFFCAGLLLLIWLFRYTPILFAMLGVSVLVFPLSTFSLMLGLTVYGLLSRRLVNRYPSSCTTDDA